MNGACASYPLGLQAAAGAGASGRRSVTAFRNLTDAISRLSMSSVVLVCRKAWMNSSGTAVISPKAVQFMATEMLAESRLAFSAGFTVATVMGLINAFHAVATESGREG